MNLTDRQGLNDPNESAASWAARLDRDPFAWEDEDFKAWLNDGANHRGALLRAQALLHAIDEPVARPDQPESDSAMSRRRIAWPKAAIAAGLLALISIAGLTFGKGGETWRTAIGEQRAIPLADGSTIAVNTASEVSATLSTKRREITLVRGEALFRVAPNKARPFVVETAGFEVRAVGTVFGVRMDQAKAGSDVVNVLVDEGVVEVRKMGGRAVIARLTAGMRGRFAGDMAWTERPPPATIARQLAWRNGQIDLAGEPLGDAVVEMNRYSARPIKIADPDLTRRALHGVFRTDDAAGFARTVAVALKVPVVISNNEIIVGQQR